MTTNQAEDFEKDRKMRYRLILCESLSSLLICARNSTSAHPRSFDSLPIRKKEYNVSPDVGGPKDLRVNFIEI